MRTSGKRWGGRERCETPPARRTLEPVDERAAAASRDTGVRLDGGRPPGQNRGADVGVELDPLSGPPASFEAEAHEVGRRVTEGEPREVIPSRHPNGKTAVDCQAPDSQLDFGAGADLVLAHEDGRENRAGLGVFQGHGSSGSCGRRPSQVHTVFPVDIGTNRRRDRPAETKAEGVGLEAADVVLGFQEPGGDAATEQRRARGVDRPTHDGFPVPKASRRVGSVSSRLVTGEHHIRGVAVAVAVEVEVPGRGVFPTTEGAPQKVTVPLTILDLLVETERQGRVAVPAGLGIGVVAVPAGGVEGLVGGLAVLDLAAEAAGGRGGGGGVGGRGGGGNASQGHTRRFARQETTETGAGLAAGRGGDFAKGNALGVGDHDERQNEGRDQGHGWKPPGGRKRPGWGTVVSRYYRTDRDGRIFL